MPIGNFRSPPNNEPRKPTPPPSEPQKAEEAVPDAAAPAAEPKEIPDADLTPGERYLKTLKEANITLDDAMVIYDAVLEKGYYEEYVRIRGGNRAVFRTRQYEDTIRLQTALELNKPSLVMSQQEIITRYNLAASLYEWRGQSLKHETEKDFDAVLDIVKKMPAPLFSLLARELAQFDHKVMIIFSDGAAENF